MGCTVGRTPGGLTAGRGRGVLGLGGLRACEGVRGCVRACFTLSLYKFPVAHGHLQILCGTRSSQIFCGTWSSQIFCGTRSFTNSLWHMVTYKFSVAHGHFKLRIN